ncbi:hypothetical protein LOC71_09085 [Rhodopirellula sp. JC740]|uniref:Uncharacterized protein n=1 Tax=Rhodopirellula halodulae TaxID=2894198 RepID=A0ABS8NFU5_9BACT|nr:hypothetical protein [Rhodopirellula sp. JC740]MCC9642426.1 hypothetical protein [Rhodopirellula sp. JC740]
MKELPPETLERLRSLILEGNKIQAIKLYREATDASLRESKVQIEQLSDELRISHPKQMTVNESTGCAGMLLLSILPLGGIVYALIV